MKEKSKINLITTRPAKTGLVVMAGVGIAGSYEGLKNFADSVGFSTSGLTGEALILRILNYLTALFVTFFICIILVSGFKWMTAGGSKDKIESAKKFVVNAVIGIVIVLAAWTIVRIVFGFNNFLDNTIEKKSATSPYLNSATIPGITED